MLPEIAIDRMGVLTVNFHFLEEGEFGAKLVPYKF